MDKTQNNLELRNLLNDFFQDIDPDAIIGDNIANRIVDVHLAKIQKYLDSQIKQSNETYGKEIRKLKKAMEDKDWEVAHGIYDTIVGNIAFEARPELVKKLDEIIEEATFWYA